MSHYLFGGWRDGGFLKDGSDAFSSIDRVMEYLVIRLITCLARQIVTLPFGNVKVWLNPLLNNEVAGVVSHFLPRNVHHGRSHNSVIFREGRIVAKAHTAWKPSKILRARSCIGGR